MEITEISIKNIKGFGEPANIIKLDNSIKSNKVNLLVAPNGWGKSSLTVAFESLKTNKLDIANENKYKQDETLDSEIILTIDGCKYVADKSKNEIHDLLNTHVIHCDTYPGTIQRNMGKFHTSTGYIGIKPIEICKIPQKVKLIYKFTEEKKAFGKNCKILINLKEKFSNPEYVKLINDEVFDCIKKLEGATIQSLINRIRDYINLKSGTADTIKNTIDNNIFDEINQNENYIYIKDIFCTGLSEIDSFTNILQLISFIKTNSKRNIKAYQKIYEYYLFTEKLNQNIKNVDTTWKNIKCSEHDDKLFVDFPNADLISNGQRDIITFTVHLQVFKSKIQIGKKYLLIIDEVFDYLDDANVLAAQYYLTDLINYAKHNDIDITLCLLTHLDPKYFRNYSFNKKILNICYLKDVQAKASDSMKYFIAFRQSLNHKDEGIEKDLWINLSKYCFHYHKNDPNFKSMILPYKAGKWQKLNIDFCEGNNLFIYLIDELNKYLSNSPVYDPYAVSLAIRIETEKKVYEQFENEDDKNSFMNEHDKGTKDKIEFAETKNIIIPDAYYILSLIHGESDHIEYDESQMKFNEKNIVYKLNNNVIKHMIAELFDYQTGVPVALSKIH